MAYDYGATKPGDWLQGRQYDENGSAVGFDPSHLNTVNGQTQQANYGDYFNGLMNQGIVSSNNMRAGSDVYGGQGNQWFNGTDGNIYMTDGTGQHPLTQIPLSNLDANGKDKVGSVSNFLDPKTGAVTGTGQANFAKMDPGEMLALASIAAMTGGAAMTGMGALGGAAGAGTGSVGGAGGFIGEGATSGIGAWDGALASAPSWSAPAAGSAGAAFNAAKDSQLANEVLGLTPADVSSATIPSVTVNGVPGGSWLDGPMGDIGKAMLKKAGTSLLGGALKGGGLGGGGSPGGSYSLPQPQSQPGTFVSPAPGYYSIASPPKNPYALGLMRGSNGN